MRALTGIGILFILAVIGFKAGDSAPSAPASPSCKSDWTLCTDNSDMANNYKGWFDVKYDCKEQATDMAKYGTPEWPSAFYFASFYPGTNYKTGLVTVIEPKAKFQNGFGAMVHSKVVCEYDLRTKKVTNVTISAR
jgi:hypothetical protein